MVGRHLRWRSSSGSRSSGSARVVGIRVGAHGLLLVCLLLASQLVSRNLVLDALLGRRVVELLLPLRLRLLDLFLFPQLLLHIIALARVFLPNLLIAPLCNLVLLRLARTLLGEFGAHRREFGDFLFFGQGSEFFGGLGEVVMSGLFGVELGL